MLILLATITVSARITTKERTVTKVGCSVTFAVVFNISRRGDEGWGRLPNKFSFGTAPSRYTNPYPFQYYFMTEKVACS